jgi:hypothetical protein
MVAAAAVAGEVVDVRTMLAEHEPRAARGVGAPASEAAWSGARGRRD